MNVNRTRGWELLTWNLCKLRACPLQGCSISSIIRLLPGLLVELKSNDVIVSRRQTGLFLWSSTETLGSVEIELWRLGSQGKEGFLWVEEVNYPSEHGKSPVNKTGPSWIE